MNVNEGYLFTPPKRVTSPTLGPPPPCKQVLSLLILTTEARSIGAQWEMGKRKERTRLSLSFSSFPPPLAHPLVTLLAFPCSRVIQIQSTGEEPGTDSIAEFTRFAFNVD